MRGQHTCSTFDGPSGCWRRLLTHERPIGNSATARVTCDLAGAFGSRASRLRSLVGFEGVAVAENHGCRSYMCLCLGDKVRRFLCVNFGEKRATNGSAAGLLYTTLRLSKRGAGHVVLPGSSVLRAVAHKIEEAA